jgi:hypothetical protein
LTCWCGPNNLLLPVRAAPKLLDVNYLHVIGTRQLNQSKPFELRECTADRFHAQTEEISNVSPCYGQIKAASALSILLIASRECQQEGGDTFDGAAPSDGEHEITGSCQLDSQSLIEFKADQRIRGSTKHLGRETAQPRRRDGLRVHQVLTVGAEPYDIAPKGKAQYLAPPIGEQFVESDGTSLDPIDVCGRISFAEYELLGFDPAQPSPC